MQIAEQLVKNGMAAGTAFMDAITKLIVDNKITRVIETGTYLGTGTTQAVWKGLEATGEQTRTFVSIEVNPDNHFHAVRNNKGRKIDFLMGLSIPRESLPKRNEITFEGYDDSVIVDHNEANRAKLYYQETAHNVPDRMLDKALVLTAYYPHLVILDSGGHVGMLEFDYLMSMVKGDLYLALDDTNHVKHFDTVKKIETDDRFTLTFQTDEKFGSRIYYVQTNGSHKRVSEPVRLEGDSHDADNGSAIPTTPDELI